MKNGLTNFEFKLTNGNTIYVECWWTYGHHYAYEKLNGRKTTYNFGNRPWENFRYETVLRNVAKKFEPADRDFIYEQIEQIGKKESEECERMCKKFEERYNNLHPRIKEGLANACPEITSVEQAEDIMKMSEGFSLMMNLLEK